MSAPPDHGVPDREWTTAHAPEHDQFRLWQEAVEQAFVPVTVGRPVGGAFDSGVAMRRLGPIDVADIGAPAQTVSRTDADIRRGTGDVFFLNLPLSAGTSARQGDNTARLSAGDLVLLDGDRPFELQFGGRFHQVSLTLPRDLLHLRLLAPGEVTGRRVPGGRGIGAVASATIHAAAASAASLDRRTSQALSEQLADLVALAVGGVRPQRPNVSGALLLQAALAEVERRLSDPELTPAAVAHNVGISTRYLHRLFVDHGPTFGRWVLAQRLARARRVLSDPARAHRSIAEVAGECGFADPSYFARTFRAQYGNSPREFRTAAVRSVRGAP